MFKHVYFDGCNGDQMGDIYDFEGAVQLLLEESSEFSTWTEEAARASLQEAMDNNEELVIDYNGDQMSRLIPV
jgi:hypothetical protein